MPLLRSTSQCEFDRSHHRPLTRLANKRSAPGTGKIVRGALVSSWLLEASRNEGRRTPTAPDLVEQSDRTATIEVPDRIISTAAQAPRFDNLGFT